MTTRPSSRRWFILCLASLLVFGNYYSYDLPAALNIPLRTMLQHMTEYDFNIHFNLFYSLYSLPNILLPFIGGILMDKFGIHSLLFILSILVLLGQGFFTLGIMTSNVWIMHLGRFIFGVGGESLNVAQSRITTSWFKDKELALALGMNLAIGRLGSVLNDLLSPFLAFHWNVSVAIWFGTLMCLFSFMCAVWLIQLDKEGLEEVDELSLDSLSFHDSLEDSLEENGKDLRLPESTQVEVEQETLLHVDSIVGKKESETKSILSLPLLYWILCALMCFYYAADIPFNAIHAAFLQSRWYKKDPQTASQIMGIPDTLSAIFVPFIGIFVDKYGHRSFLLVICGIIMSSVHLFFLTSTASSPSPIPGLMLLGLAYALLSIIWPCIPLLVPNELLATCFGLATCLLNLTFFTTPLIVAYLMNLNAFFVYVELFFVSCCGIGLFFSIALYFKDSKRILSSNLISIS